MTWPVPLFAKQKWIEVCSEGGACCLTGGAGVGYFIGGFGKC
jgi:hypothetical protein